MNKYHSHGLKKIVVACRSSPTIAAFTLFTTCRAKNDELGNGQLNELRPHMCNHENSENCAPKQNPLIEMEGSTSKLKSLEMRKYTFEYSALVIATLLSFKYLFFPLWRVKRQQHPGGTAQTALISQVVTDLMSDSCLAASERCGFLAKS